VTHFKNTQTHLTTTKTKKSVICESKNHEQKNMFQRDDFSFLACALACLIIKLEERERGVEHIICKLSFN
jgi:hypothetical protein